MKRLLTLMLLLVLACGGGTAGDESPDGGSGGGSGSGGTGGASNVDSGSGGGGGPGSGGAGGTSTQDAAAGAAGAADTRIDLTPPIGDAAACGDAGLAECDTSTVTCRVAPPVCPAGHLPVVSGSCWAGCCVKASACRSVKDCSACSRDSYVCATDQLSTGVLRRRCADVPAACVNDRTCVCLRPTLCEPFGFMSCGDPGNGFEFSCL